jgi:hypothetical protein
LPVAGSYRGRIPFRWSTPNLQGRRKRQCCSRSQSDNPLRNQPTPKSRPSPARERRFFFPTSSHPPYPESRNTRELRLNHGFETHCHAYLSGVTHGAPSRMLGSYWNGKQDYRGKKSALSGSGQYENQKKDQHKMPTTYRLFLFCFLSTAFRKS